MLVSLYSHQPKRENMQTQATASANLNLQSSKIDRCPNCFRVVNKRTAFEGMPVIHMKHRGSELYAEAAIIRCLGCNRYYSVTAKEGIVKQVEIPSA